jgi:hypothetical protein
MDLPESKQIPLPLIITVTVLDKDETCLSDRLSRRINGHKSPERLVIGSIGDESRSVAFQPTDDESFRWRARTTVFDGVCLFYEGYQEVIVQEAAYSRSLPR